MAKLAYFLSPKVSDAATFTGSTTVASGSISNLQNPRPNYRAIFTGTTVNIEIDMLSAKACDTLALGFINSLSASDTFQLRAKASYPVTSSPTYDSGTLPVWPSGSALANYARMHRHFEFASNTLRYWRVDLVCSVAPEIGRLILGTRVELAAGVSLNLDPRGTEPIAASRDLGGEQSIRPMGGSARSLPVDWPRLTQAEALGSLYEFLLERGASRDFLFVADKEEAAYPMPLTYIGVARDTSIGLAPNTTSNYRASLVVEELAPLRMV